MALKNNFVKVFNYPSMLGLPHPFTYVMVICVMSSLLNCTNFNCVSPIGVLYMAYLLRLTMNASGMAMTNALWSGFSVMATTIVGIMLFKEVLHYHDYFAILLIVTGVMILKVTD